MTTPPAPVSMMNILINRHLPEELRDDRRIYDKKSVDVLLTEVARRYPDQYPRIAKAIGDIGRKQVYRSGQTFRFEDFRPVLDRKPIFDALDKEEAEVMRSVKDEDLRDEALSRLYGAYSDRIAKETGKAALAKGNNIALTVLSGARGKEAQMRDLISTPGFYVDGRNRPVRGFIRNSFAEGLRPADYMAGTFGARAAVTESKKAVAKGGFLSKTLSRANATNYITEEDCGTTNGLDLSTDEPDLRGRVLQRETAGYPPGTVVDRKVLKTLKAKGVDEVIARSPMTCQAPAGMCAKCFGVMAEGRFPKVGDAVGITSSNALGEPIAQGALCLVDYTLVKMADGSSRPLVDIRVGDRVLGSDKAGAVRPVTVTAVIDQGFQPVRTYRFQRRHQKSEVRCTDDHKFLMSRTPDGSGMISDAAVLPAGEFVLQGTAGAFSADGPVAFEGRDEELAMERCMDITVDHPDHLFVLANGIIVSNSMKHVTSASGPKTEFSGLDYINQFVESPEEFKDRAVVAEEPGRVDAIQEAPQGGHYILIGDKKHYVPVDRVISVNKGDELEAGDVMTDGLPDPEDVVRHKGLGAGRRYYAEKLGEIAKASGAGMDKRLFETLARSAIDHVRLDDPVEEGYLPDDLVSYNAFIGKRTLPAKVYQARAHQAVGKYLEAPALHHTVGTRITPKIASELAAKGFEDLHVSDTEPSFRPEMVRLQQVAAISDDWLASQGGSYLGKQLAEGIGRSQDTNILSNIHPVPRLAVGVGYADNLETTGKF